MVASETGPVGAPIKLTKPTLAGTVAALLVTLRCAVRCANAPDISRATFGDALLIPMNPCEKE